MTSKAIRKMKVQPTVTGKGSKLTLEIVRYDAHSGLRYMVNGDPCNSIVDVIHCVIACIRNWENKN